MGCVTSLEAGMALVDVIWQSLSSTAPANIGIPSEMSNQIIWAEKWQQQPICHIFSTQQHTSFSLIHSSPSQKNNKMNSLNAVQLIGLILVPIVKFNLNQKINFVFCFWQTSAVNTRAKKNKCTEMLHHYIIASRSGKSISLFIIYTELSRI